MTRAARLHRPGDARLPRPRRRGAGHRPRDPGRSARSPAPATRCARDPRRRRPRPPARSSSPPTPSSWTCKRWRKATKPEREGPPQAALEPAPDGRHQEPDGVHLHRRGDSTASTSSATSCARSAGHQLHRLPAGPVIGCVANWTRRARDGVCPAARERQAAGAAPPAGRRSSPGVDLPSAAESDEPAPAPEVTAARPRRMSAAAADDPTEEGGRRAGPPPSQAHAADGLPSAEALLTSSWGTSR